MGAFFNKKKVSFKKIIYLYININKNLTFFFTKKRYKKIIKKNIKWRIVRIKLTLTDPQTVVLSLNYILFFLIKNFIY
jgi:hypothetical protein